MANIKIPLEEIESSNIRAAGYDRHKQILAVQFKSGPIFHYASVPLEEATAFYLAPSKGSHYALNIKGKFTGQKMTGTCPKCGDEHGWIGDVCADCGTAEYAETPRPAAKEA